MPRRAKALKPGRTEAQVLAQCLDALRLFGIVPERRNVGGALNVSGQYVAFGDAGDSDITCILPRSFGLAAGKRLDVEVKREGFRPEKARGREKERFARQLAKLRRINEEGGFGLWVRDAWHLLFALSHIKDGYRIDIDERGYCHVQKEDPCPAPASS